MDFFRVFDVRDKGAITKREFEDGSRKFGFLPTRAELDLVFQRFDRNQD